MFADIAHGHVDGADVCFLLAVVLAGLAAIVGAVRTAPNDLARFAHPLLAAAVGLAALGWLIL